MNAYDNLSYSNDLGVNVSWEAGRVFEEAADILKSTISFVEDNCRVEGFTEGLQKALDAQFKNARPGDAEEMSHFMSMVLAHMACFSVGFAQGNHMAKEILARPTTGEGEVVPNMVGRGLNNPVVTFDDVPEDLPKSTRQAIYEANLDAALQRYVNVELMPSEMPAAEAWRKVEEIRAAVRKVYVDRADLSMDHQTIVSKATDVIHGRA